MPMVLKNSLLREDVWIYVDIAELNGSIWIRSSQDYLLHMLPYELSFENEDRKIENILRN